MKRLVFAVTATVFALWLIGQVFRDRLWPTALCFYLPSPLVAGVLLGVALLAWRRSWRQTALAAGLLALSPLAFMLGVENRWTVPRPGLGPAQRHRLVHWNVGGGALGWARVEETLRGLGADAVVLSEVPRDAPLEALAAELGPEFVAVRRGNLAVLARGRLDAGAAEGSGGARWFAAEWEVEGMHLALLVVDLPSSLAVERAPLLAKVRGRIAEAGPDLVVGDFNAPRRSLGLADLPEGYRHAYDEAGSGWSYTWPVPVPLWAIDQCVVGPRLEAGRYELRSTTASDHRLQVLEFGLRSP